ncbi:synaptonemal complex protein 2 isoform X2 [Monodelphis domestica]|uniref:synaptonemal complex protein 2 isoform X2 n=1 Tax=Monodelphis domestica TaxID=13616 RepID=UPI0024E1B93D|nr:synaptonemal complex protein 2 isoform X2 [Monodelphis domestica]
MPVRPELQFEKRIDDALRKNDFKPLEQFLQMENDNNITLKCSKQFFSKLDNLMCKELNKKDIQNISTILNALGKYGKNISIFGEAGLLVMTKQGLIKKMVAWFEKIKEIILSHKNEKDEAMMNLIEDFFDVLMTVHDINNEGKMEVLEDFILRICALVVDMRIHICIRQEAIKKLNALLDNISRDARKIISKPEMLSLMIDMGKRILDAGDYDFQVGITEALCRMTSEKQRRELACQWFSMEFVANAFKGIKDSDFETDCRKFLNHVNGMLGDKRLVFTFPCLSVFLDKCEIPSDEKLDEFWIDFNLGSQSISFYIAGDDDDHQWETVSIPNDEVEAFSVEVKDAKKLLTLILKNTMNVGNKVGGQLLLYFDPSLEIIDVTKNIYGANKHRGFTRKQASSVAKTAVHIIFDESGSQILLPESQNSPATKENFLSVDEKPNRKQQFSLSQKDMSEIINQQDSRNTRSQMIMPVKRKMSEATMVIPGTDKLTVKTLITNTSTPRIGRVKPPLKMVNSAEPPSVYKVKERGAKNAVSLPGSVEGRNPHSYQSDFPKSQITVSKVSEAIENDVNRNVLVKQNTNGDVDIIPDSQPVGKKDKPLLPGVLDNFCENDIYSKWTCWTPITNIKICSKESASTSPEETFNQDILTERVSKKSSISSISDDITLEKPLVQNQKRKGDMENNRKKKKVETYETNRQSLNHSISIGQENIEKNKENDWHIESETFKSVLLNRTIEKSLIYTKKLVLAKDLNTDCYDKTISSGMNAKSNRRPVKGKTSEIRSCDLETNRKKEKTKEKQFTDATESLINQINKRYNQKDDLNSSRKFRESLNDRKDSNKIGLLINKEKFQNKNSRQLKRTTFVNMTSECALNDVYNFNLNGADDPTIRLGTEEFHTTIRETSVTNSKKLSGLRSHDGSEASLKGKDKKIRTNKKKKHLFSDTDTDHRGDDSKTDISWLRESNEKAKPHLVDYSRNKKVKKPKNVKSSKIIKSGPSVEVKLSKPKKTHNTDPTNKVDERSTEATRPQRPRRAGLVKKNYKDFSNSESETEQESLPSPPSKEKSLVQLANMCNKSKTGKYLKKGQNDIPNEAEEEILKEGKKSSKAKDCIREKRLDSSPIPLPGSPASIEVMRCSGKTIEREFIQDYIPSIKSTSTFSQSSTPEKGESLNSMHGITGNSFYTTNMKIQSKCLEESPENIDENLMCAKKHFSSPLFLPKITPLIMDKIDDTGKDVEIPSQNIPDYDNPVDLRSCNSEKQFSGSELKKIHENSIQSIRKEPLSPSRLSITSSKREKLYDVALDTLHRKGSSTHTNLKRLCTSDNLSNSDEVEVDEEDEERGQTLLPPKLFKTDSDHVTYKVSGSISTLSANEFSFPGEAWETESSGVGIMCQKLSKEFKRKIQNRYKRMDHFNKQSLKSAQQHLTSLNYHIHEYRMKQLDKFQFNIIEEIENFEKDSQSLRNLEREFSDFWKKTSQKFSAYQKSEQRRVHLLKTSLEKNVFHNIDYEENIFTSEMYLMKEDMKRLQERFLKEMQEEELLNVRRGLMSLLTSDERKF